MDLRARIDAAPMTSYQWLIVGLCVVLNILDGFDVMALAFTAAAVGEEFQLSGSVLGLLLSAALVGMAVGALVLGPVADKVGRRPTVLVSVALAAIGPALVAVSGSALEVGIWRFVTGLGVGGVLVCTTVIVSEYSSARWRGLAVSIYAAGFGVGATLGGLAAVSLQEGFGWRGVFVAGALLSAIVLVALIAVLPESIDFLRVRARQKDRARISQLARRMGHDLDAVDAELARNPHAARDGMEAAGRIGGLFRGARRRRTLLLWAAFFCTMFGFYFANSWTPTLLETSGLSREQSANLGMMVALGGAVGSVLFGLCASRWAARTVLVWFLLSSAATMTVLIAATALMPVAFVIGVLIGALINGCIAGLYTLAPAQYGPRLRSTGVGWAIGVGRAGAILAPLAAGALLDLAWTPAQLYGAVAGVVVLGAAAVFLLPRPAPEPAPESPVEPAGGAGTPLRTGAAGPGGAG